MLIHFTYSIIYKICRESKLYPAIKDETVATILNAIDTQTATGKRDYAIILLGYVLGIRAIDIIKLKLSDIHWECGEISFIQSKTQEAVVLPLTQDVGEALRDYILNGRPQVDYMEIFLRAQPPFFPLKDARCINSQFDVYCKRAGIQREAYDGFSFHSLRRSLGKRMITSGNQVDVTAQVLGHSDIESTKKYIGLDSEHLSECALGLLGIEPEVNL